MSGIVSKNGGRSSGIVGAGDVGADAVDGSNIADDAIDSEHYAAGSIDEAHIADNAVTLAKMAGGTDGQIISWDASGDPVALGPGTDGQVLTSTGAGSPPAFEAAGSGTIVYDLHFTAGFDADATHMTKENATVGTYGEMVMARSGTFVGAAGYCDTFSGPGYTEVDILKNGTTIYSTKPSFGSSAMGTSPGPALSVTTFAANDRITFRVHSNANGNSQGIRFTLKCTV